MKDEEIKKSNACIHFYTTSHINLFQNIFFIREILKILIVSFNILGARPIVIYFICNVCKAIARHIGIAASSICVFSGANPH